MTARINIVNNNGSVIFGDNNRYESDDISITVSHDDQRQIISYLLEEVLRHKARFSKDVLETASNLQQALKTDAAKPTEKTQSMLGKIWKGLTEVTGFSANLAKISEFVITHSDAIAGVIAVAARSLR